MRKPRLTFFCEQDSTDLVELFQDPGVIDELIALQAGISLAVIEMSEKRADIVRMINKSGLPLFAWLVLPSDQGYYMNLDNYPQAATRYREFQNWTVKNQLSWTGVGLAIEPDIRMLKELSTRKWRAIPGMLPRLIKNMFSQKRFRQAFKAYRELIAQIHIDGYMVESYQFPVLADERTIRSTLLQRLTGIVDLPVDREIWMLYSSYFRRNGAGYLWSYAPQAQIIGVGSTGGGVDIGNTDMTALGWDELSRDLRLAWHWTDQIYVHSLEGCIRQGYFTKINSMLWDQPILFPDEAAAPVDTARKVLQSCLWMCRNFIAVLASLLGGYVILDAVRRHYQNKNSIIGE